MEAETLIAILLLSPLVGFLINGINFRRFSCRVSGTIASLAAGISFLCSGVLFKTLIALPEEQRRVGAQFFNWIDTGILRVPAGFVVDQISALMILVVTGVGTLIHIYSIGYMSHDERPAKYFSYLNFFLFNMLLLVLGDNLLVMFVGWEGVGLCSYLLIGFWFSDREKAAAGMKAFVTNRIGDAGFLLGIFILFLSFGTLDFASLMHQAPLQQDTFWISLACLFLFVGATGKSAQIPLYVWLPDAMAGPTPVSALIHAATMVTAGVYMIVRMNALFVMAPVVMAIIAIIGALTAIVAATIGMTQYDIKKVLAYSTVSQLGYMFLATGVGAFGAAMFHLTTHAFFKALMFLGSGSVIHAMDGEQDIRKMGGLARKLSITHATFLIGWLAIIGIPPFAGFFSKDEILWRAFASSRGHVFLWLAGAIGAGLTAFYMTRLMALTFWGKSRVSGDVHPHESPASMTMPLVVLAVLSAVGGWIGIPHILGHVIHVPNLFEGWLEPLIAEVPMLPISGNIEMLLMLLSVVIATLSATLGYQIYVKEPAQAEKAALRYPKTYKLIFNKYFVDEFYFSKIIDPIVALAKGLWLYIDINIIDRITYVLSDFVGDVGRAIRSLQNGNLQQYAFYTALGLLTIITFVLMR